MIAEYITREEYACPCCDGLPVDLYDFRGFLSEHYKYLFKAFAWIRREWGKPILISSGFRCEEYNSSISGVPMSIHLFGLALDLDVSPNEVSELDRLIEKWWGELRRGTYTQSGSFIHIDCGYLIQPRALPEWHKKARWTG